MQGQARFMFKVLSAAGGGADLVQGEGVPGTVARHTHASYILGLVESGERVMQLGTRELTIPAGCMFVVHPNQPHACLAPTDCELAFCALALPAAYVAKVARDAGCGGGLPRFPDAYFRNSALARNLKSLAGATGAATAETETLLLETVVLLLEEHALDNPEPPPLIPGLVHKAVNAIKEHHAAPLDLHELAENVGISPFHLHRLFVRSMGVTPLAWQMQVRVGRARQLMREGYSACAAGHEVGFCDQSHFTRAFKKIMGLPPGAYLRSCGD